MTFNASLRDAAAFNASSSTTSTCCLGKRRMVDMECQDVVAGFNQIGLQSLQVGDAMAARRSFARALSQATSTATWPLLKSLNEFALDVGSLQGEERDHR